MQVDTGASISIMGKKAYSSLWDQPPVLYSSHMKLQTYTGEEIKVVGSTTVNINYMGKQKKLPLTIVEGDGPSLFGRDWLQEIQLDWRNINQVQMPIPELDDVFKKYTDLFKPELGEIEGVTVDIQVDPKSQPQFYKARSVPYALKEKVELELRAFTQGWCY